MKTNLVLALLPLVLGFSAQASDCPSLEGTYELITQINSDGTTRDLSGQTVKLQQTGCESMVLTLSEKNEITRAQTVSLDGKPNELFSEGASVPLYTTDHFDQGVMVEDYGYLVAGVFQSTGMTARYDLDANNTLRVVITESENGSVKTHTETSRRVR